MTTADVNRHEGRICSRSLAEHGLQRPAPISIAETICVAPSWVTPAAESARVPVACESPRSERMHPSVTRALCAIRDRAADPELRLSCVANAAGVSPSHLDKLLKATTGKTFLQHVRYVRLTAVEKLLVATDDPIKVIALSCGFSQTACLDRTFRAAFGCPPGEWRRRRRQSLAVGLSR
jgi:transcriptional regulator GlxA family with amidase domain